MTVVSERINTPVLDNKPLTYLPGKHGKFAVYLHWLLQKLNDNAPHDLATAASDALIAITKLHTKDFAGQVAFYEQFFADEKEAAKELKALIKQSNKPIKKTKIDKSVVTESTASTDALPTEVVSVEKGKKEKKQPKEPKEQKVVPAKKEKKQPKEPKEPKEQKVVPVKKTKKSVSSEETVTNNDIISQIVSRANSLDELVLDDSLQVPSVVVTEPVLPVNGDSKAEKEAKKNAEKAEKEAKKNAEKAEKEAKKNAEKQGKLEKEAKKNAEKQGKVEKEVKNVEKVEVVEGNVEKVEVEVVKEKEGKVVKEKVVKEKEGKVVKEKEGKVVKEKEEKVVKEKEEKVVKEKEGKEKVVKEGKEKVVKEKEGKEKEGNDLNDSVVEVEADLSGDDSDNESVELQVHLVNVNGIDCYQDDSGALYSLDLIPL